MTDASNKLFQYNDGSYLKQIQASHIADMDIWKGNRIIDRAHCEAICKEVGDNVKRLDLKPFHIVRYMKETENGTTEHVKELVDGQHRATILKEFFDSKGDDWEAYDFPVLAIVKCCANEQAIIEYFRMLNNTKAIEWKEDPNVAANTYLAALLRRFNNPKKPLIREGKTRAPYIGVEAIREEMVRRQIGIMTKQTPTEWAEAIWKEHQAGLQELRDLQTKTAAQTSALKAGCMLALFKNMEWLEPS
jgi:hypothetical protein